MNIIFYMFHTFTPTEQKLEKEEFESAENIFIRTVGVIAAALALIASSHAPDYAKQASKEFVEADCSHRPALKATGEHIIQTGHNSDAEKLWDEVTHLMAGVQCPTDVVSASSIRETMTPEQMQEYIAKAETEKNKNRIKEHNERRAAEKARQLEVQKEHKAQIWMLNVFRNSPDALVHIIEENAQKIWDTEEQTQFWKQKRVQVREYLQTVKNDREAREAQTEHIIKVIFGGVKLFIGAILATVSYDELKRRFAKD